MGHSRKPEASSTPARCSSATTPPSPAAAHTTSTAASLTRRRLTSAAAPLRRVGCFPQTTGPPAPHISQRPLIGNDATVASSGTYNLNGGQLNATTIDFGGGTAAAVRLFSQSNGTLVTNYLRLPANGTFSYSGGLGTSVGTIALAGGKFRSSA